MILLLVDFKSAFLCRFVRIKRSNIQFVQNQDEFCHKIGIGSPIKLLHGIKKNLFLLYKKSINRLISDLNSDLVFKIKS